MEKIMGRNSYTDRSNMAIKMAEIWRTAVICPIHRRETNCNVAVREGSHCYKNLSNIL
jgi:hypothetical protein